MTKTQALALMNALEGAGVPASVSFAFPSAGVEVWTVALSTTTVYTGDQLAALTAYCSSHGLVVSAQFAQLGIV